MGIRKKFSINIEKKVKEMNKYYKQYKWENIKQMIKNNRTEPKEINEDFKGKLVLISGATSGIGYHTARKYASHGANLLFINRNKEKTIQLCQELENEFAINCQYKIADYSKLSDVHAVAKEILKSDLKIDVIIHNAGVYLTKKTFSEDDIEMVFQVNYLSSFIITYILKEKLKSQGNTRIIYVNSEGHRFAIWGVHLDELRWKKHRYSGLKSYGSAKTAQLLSLLKFHEYFKGSGVTINAMHPGQVKSNMGANNGRFYRFWKHWFIDRSSKSPELSAQALYYLGVSKELEGVSGKFFNLTTEEEPAPPALDLEAAEKLWQKSIELGKLQ